MTTALRHRIDRLRKRHDGRSWIEPAGTNADGLVMEAHVFEHGRQRAALVVPAPIDAETWTALAQTHQAGFLERAAAPEQQIGGRG
jgi:hypothetical protein